MLPSPVNRSELPVVVIGAGPVGLAAAARLLEDGIPFWVLEAGESPAAAVQAWGHVRLFTPWRYLIDDSARTLLSGTDWVAPEPSRVPTGRELVERYLLPLAGVSGLAERLQLSTRVQSVTRAGVDKLKTVGRDQVPFTVNAVTKSGTGIVLEARAVIDASGTYASPNPLGSSGVAAFGEREASERLFYGIPDVRGRDRARFAGKRVGVVGSGHSAFNTLLELQALREATETEVTWFVRSPGTAALFGGEDLDALSERGALGRRMRQLAESGRLRIEAGFSTAAVHSSRGGVVLESHAGKRSEPLDEVVVVTGFRPEVSMTRELRLALDPVVEAPTALAPLIDPNVHSCGTVPPHGYRELGHPEPDFYVVGMKSYGRAPTFLLITGYEQVRSVVKAIGGDLEAAARVELELPETGVCDTDVSTVASCGDSQDPGAATSSCCAPNDATDASVCCAPAAASAPGSRSAPGRTSALDIGTGDRDLRE